MPRHRGTTGLGCFVLLFGGLAMLQIGVYLSPTAFLDMIWRGTEPPDLLYNANQIPEIKDHLDGLPVAATRFHGATYLFMGVGDPRNLSAAAGACRAVQGSLLTAASNSDKKLWQHLQSALLNLTHVGLLKQAEAALGLKPGMSSLTTQQLMRNFSCKARSFIDISAPQQQVHRRLVPKYSDVPVLWWLHDDTAGAQQQQQQRQAGMNRQLAMHEQHQQQLAGLPHTSSTDSCQAWAVAEGEVMAGIPCDTALPFICQVREPEPQEYSHPDMAPLVALARHALPLDVIANRTADPCRLDSTLLADAFDDEFDVLTTPPLVSSSLKSWQVGAYGSCNGTGRLLQLVIQPWHLTTAGGIMDNDYTTSSAWVTRSLAHLKQLIIQNNESQSRSALTPLYERPCVPAPLEQARTFQPAVPISTQQLAKLAPALEQLAIGDESPATNGVFNISLGPLWGVRRQRGVHLCPFCSPQDIFLETYSRFANERLQYRSASDFIAFPEGIQPLCKLRQLKLLRLYPLTELSKLAYDLPASWQKHITSPPETNNQAVVQPTTQRRHLRTAGSATAQGVIASGDLLPACLSELKNLALLELRHTTLTPLELPAEWGQLSALEALSITHAGDCEVSPTKPSATDAAGSLVDSTTGPKSRSIYGCGLALPPANYNIFQQHCSNSSHAHTCIASKCHRVQQDMCTFSHWRHKCRCAGKVATALAGTLPAAWSNMKSLRVLTLTYHNLSGSLPQSWAHGMAHLQQLRLEGNRISGSIPSDWTRLERSSNSSSSSQGSINSGGESVPPFPALEVLQLGCNNLSGALPSSLVALRNLQVVKLDANSLSGQVPSEVPASLNVLGLQHNDLTGPPPCFNMPSDRAAGAAQAAPTALKAVNLADNKLSGQLPSCLQVGAASATPNLTVLELSHQRADPSAVKAAFAAALTATAPPECQSEASDSSSSSSSSEACKRAAAVAAAAALSNLTIHGPIPDPLLSIQQLGLSGVALSGQLPAWAAGKISVADSATRHNKPGPLLAEDVQLTATQQLTGGFNSSIEASWLSAACANDRPAKAFVSLKVDGPSAQLTIHYPGGAQQTLFLDTTKQDPVSSYTGGRGYYDDYFDDIFQGSAPLPASPPSQVFCHKTTAGNLARILIQSHEHNRMLSEDEQGRRTCTAGSNCTSEPSAAEALALSKLDAERAALWQLWMTAQHVHVQGETQPGPAAVDVPEGPPPVPGAESNSATAAAASIGYVDVGLSNVCKSIEKEALRAAASRSKWGLLFTGVLLAAVFAAGTMLGLRSLCCSYPAASSRGDCDFDPVGKWLQEQLHPGHLTQAGLLLVTAILFVSLLGLPGILPRVAAFSLLHGSRSVWLFNALLLFVAACTTSVFLAVVAAAANQVRMARQQQVSDIECQLRQLQQTKPTSTGAPGTAVSTLGSSSSTTAGGLHDPLVGDDDGTCPLPPGTSPVLVAFDGASKMHGRLVGWLLVPLIWMFLALLLPVVVGTVAWGQLMPAWLVLQLPVNLLLRGGRVRLLRLLHLMFASLISPVIAVAAIHAPQLNDGFTWVLPYQERVQFASLFPFLFQRLTGSSVDNTIGDYYVAYDYNHGPQKHQGVLAQVFTTGLEQGLLDQGLRPVVAALQVKPLLLLVLCALHVFVAMWELGWCAVALWLCLKHDGQPTTSLQQGKDAGVDAAGTGAGAGTRQLPKLLGRFVVARAMVDLMMILTALPLLLLWVLACGLKPLFDSVVALLCSVLWCCLACNLLCRWVVHVFMAALTGNSNREYAPVMFDAAMNGGGHDTSSDVQSSCSGSRQSWLVGLAVDGFPHLVCKPVQQQQRKGAEQQEQHIDELASIAAAEAEAFSLPAFCKCTGFVVAVVVLSNIALLCWYLVAYTGWVRLM